MINSRVEAPFPMEAPAYTFSYVESVSGLSDLRAVQAHAANAAYRLERVKSSSLTRFWARLSANI